MCSAAIRNDGGDGREAEVRPFPGFAVQPEVNSSSALEQQPRESKDSQGSSRGKGEEKKEERERKMENGKKGENNPSLGCQTR